jgi:hypothetical protein
MMKRSSPPCIALLLTTKFTLTKGFTAVSKYGKTLLPRFCIFITFSNILQHSIMHNVIGKAALMPNYACHNNYSPPPSIPKPIFDIAVAITTVV